jgi:2,5-diamino-6-(ribosylamino)-4(3H)-pyrimidinone 5'-phosphate reductase
MFPKVIMHNTISLDGSLKDFNIDMEQHYQIVGRFNADTHLIGSNTIRSGLEQFFEKIPKEKESDFFKPESKKDDNRPYWAIVDSNGKMLNILHIIRQFDYCKHIIVFVSKKTDKNYLKYLTDRNYDFHITGEQKVDIKRVLQILQNKYNSKIVMTDSGGTLNSILLEKGLIDEISLIISPVIVGKKTVEVFNKDMFSKYTFGLELITNEKLENNNILVHYKVVKGEKNV